MLLLALALAVTVPPPRTNEAIIAVVKEASPRLRACLVGTRGQTDFHLQWDIPPDGVPTNVTVEPPVLDGPKRACVVAELSALRWAPGRTKHVDVPFKVKGPPLSDRERKTRRLHDDIDVARPRGGDCAELDPDMKPSPRTRRDVLSVVKATLPLLVMACGKSDDVMRAGWIIETDGRTVDVTIEAPFAGTPLGMCVAGELAKMEFAPRSARAPVHFPLRLR